MINIFEYSNYRQFLNDYLKSVKKFRNHLSHRGIIQKLGIKSTGFLSNVISGKNNLTNSQVIKLTSIFKFSKLEGDFFTEMVNFTQAKSLEEKNLYYNKMAGLTRSKFKTLDAGQMSLFARWHYAVIRELIHFMEFKDDYQLLASQLTPAITVKQARDAVENLEKMGLISRDENGIYRQKDSLVTTRDEVKSLQVANFQIATMEVAQRTLDKVPASERDISVVTFTLSDDSMKEIKSEIQKFRKKILSIAENDQNTDRVFQFNTNFFPVSRKNTGDK